MTQQELMADMRKHALSVASEKHSAARGDLLDTAEKHYTWLMTPFTTTATDGESKLAKAKD